MTWPNRFGVDPAHDAPIDFPTQLEGHAMSLHVRVMHDAFAQNRRFPELISGAQDV
jgi:hypothetical protein